MGLLKNLLQKGLRTSLYAVAGNVLLAIGYGLSNFQPDMNNPIYNLIVPSIATAVTAVGWRIVNWNPDKANG